ncbi:hypothetical protein E6O75_ATG10259 [Venturia nashicola]|uniref:Uncharacterized protein n=1 Tax=Venturia nashicola TaxID=86259 RepID=A0A4Z1NQW8_9PEZI|nr:hypothetical protein E6O75_ATG10259 [Venturia nashicola]
MGICASCLGLERRESTSDPTDSQHLLGDPFQPNQYGTIHPDHSNRPQMDPEEIRRQRDALERLCAQTSDKLIDVAHSASAEEGGVDKLHTDYQRLFRERFTAMSLPVEESREEEDAERRPSSDSTLTDETETTWLAHIVQEDGQDILNWKASGQLGSLSVQFDDLLGPPSNNAKSPRLL